MSYFRTLMAAAVVVLALPAMAMAQASIAGVVRDTSGLVLPGVTVEASSPALIEKVRTVVTDGNGQFRIIDLRPGTYTVTFTLAGFTAVKREGLELTGSATVTANADLRVGSLEETITVTGETPIVDVQNATRQRVLSKEVIDTIPTGRYYSNLAALIPGVSVAGAPASAAGGTQDVGGTGGDSQATLTVHGSRAGDQRFTINGVTFGEGNGSTHGMGPNVTAMQEVTVDTGAVDASMGQGGVRINFIPREGGNNFQGSVAYSGAAASWQGDNIDDALRARGATTGNAVSKLYDIAPTFGGPVVRDRLWFFTSWRRNVVDNFVTNGYRNLNADPALGNANPWTYARSDEQIISQNLFRYASVRLTSQLTPRNKLSVAYDWRDRCSCPQSTTSLESGQNNSFKPMNLTTANWSAPVTSRLLLDAGFTHLDGRFFYRPTVGFVPGAIAVTESNPVPGQPATYRGRTTNQTTDFPTNNGRFTMSYVTGSHAFTTGLQFANGKNRQITYAETPTTPYSYGFTRGVPTTVTIGAWPTVTDSRTRADIGLYVQDKWTVNQLTLSGGLRFDYLNTYAAEVTLGPAWALPTREITFPETTMLRWKDLTPKVQAAYDLFGNGRTAVKVSLNKYLQQQAAGGVGSINLNPAALMVTTAQRAWTDGNGNFIPDCNLLDGSLQDNRASGGDLCGAWTGNNVNFGRTVPGTTPDPDTQFGWGKRPYNWEFSTGVQHGLTQRISMDVSYFRRWYGNFFVVDNLNLGPTDYTAFSVTAPADTRLPNGGGNVVSGFVNINPDRASVATNNVQTFAKNYGNQTEHWNGVDVSLNARLGNGILFQGGTSTGRTSTNNCEILAAVPEASPLGLPYCDFASAWLTQFKALGSYVVPRVDVQISGTYQSLPGPQLTANYVAANALVQPSLGRPLSGNAANVTVNIIEPGTFYGDRLNQLDLRVGKILRFGRARANVAFDLFNAFNGNVATAENANYSSFRTPTAILAPRIVKFSAQVDF